MRRPDDSGSYPVMGDLLYESARVEALSPEDLADVLRSSLRQEYAEASDEEMGDALENILDSMSAAEAVNFGSAFSKIGKSASRLASDPAFAQIVRVAAPIAGGALGSVIGGPVGTALGSQLGNLAAKALPVPAAPRPVPPVTAPVPPVTAPVPSAPVLAAPVPAAALPSAAAVSPSDIPSPPVATPPAAAPASSAVTSVPDTPLPGPARASSVAGGSAAAAQAFVLTQQSEFLRGLLATALGRHGRQQISGVPVAQLLTLFSQVIGQAAADADELMYLEQQADAAESVLDDAPEGSVRTLYVDLLGADNLELAEAAGWEGLD